MTEPLIDTDMPKWEGAACAGADPELFFPTERDVWWKQPEAATYCDRCPVRRPCLSYALTHDVAGIWANPAHLQPVTHAENLRRGAAARRAERAAS